MTYRELTPCAWAARSFPVKLERQVEGVSLGRLLFPAAMLVLAPLPLGGCISVNAPDKPIVIELNINIKQEVVYRLAEDVRENIDENPDIF